MDRGSEVGDETVGGGGEEGREDGDEEGKLGVA